VLHNWKTHLHSDIKFEGGVNALIGVMGSGKSSVLDALSFALFGTFPALSQRKLKLDNVIMMYPQIKKDAYVSVIIELDGLEYEVKRMVERGRGTVGSEFRCDGVLIEGSNGQRVNEKVHEILKIDFEIFSNVIYCEQNHLDQFIQIPRGKRVEKIDELLKIDRFEVARSSCVKLSNKLKQRLDIRKSDLDRLSKEMESKDIPVLKDEITKIISELEVLEKTILDLGVKKENLFKILEILNKKKIVFEKYVQEKHSLKGKLEQIEARLKSYNNLDEIKKYTLDFADKQIERLEAFILKQETLFRDIAVFKQKISDNITQSSSLQKDIELLLKNKDEYQKISDVEIQMKELENQKSENINLIAKIDAVISELNDSIGKLMQSDAKCPVCDTEFVGDKKSDLIIIKEESLKKQIIDKNNTDAILKDLLLKLDSVESQRRKLLSLSRSEEEFKVAQEKLDNLSKVHTETKIKLDDFEKQYSEDKIKTIKEEILKFRGIKQILQFISERDELLDNIKQNSIDIDELDFDLKLFELENTNYNSFDSQFKVETQRFSSLKLLLDEKQKHFNDIEAQLKIIVSYKIEIDSIESGIIDVSKFKRILEETQISLREQFIESINLTISLFWKALYPYDDYIDMRLEVDNDYLLQIMNSDNVWVSVEGIVSGGERMMAVLVLRLAMSVILAPNIKWILLDEPTHNLDTQAVDRIANAFRNNISNLMDQMFIITHDEALEVSVTGKLYKFERGDNKEDVTKVVDV